MSWRGVSRRASRPPTRSCPPSNHPLARSASRPEISLRPSSPWRPHDRRLVTEWHGDDGVFRLDQQETALSRDNQFIDRARDDADIRPVSAAVGGFEESANRPGPEVGRIVRVDRNGGYPVPAID